MVEFLLERARAFFFITHLKFLSCFGNALSYWLLGRWTSFLNPHTLTYIFLKYTGNDDGISNYGMQEGLESYQPVDSMNDQPVNSMNDQPAFPIGHRFVSESANESNADVTTQPSTNIENQIFSLQSTG